MADVGCAGLLVEDNFCGPLPALPPAGALQILEAIPVRAGGCAANVAIGLAKQGIAVDVVGCIGNDAAGEVVVRSLTGHQVGVSRIARVGQPTSRTVILLIEGEDRRYLHSVGANGTFSVAHITRPWVSQLRVFYLGGLFALPGLDIKQLASLLEFCRFRGVVTVLDVAVPEALHGMSDLLSLLPHVDVFLPNEDEARAFTGSNNPMDQLRAFERAGARTVIITRGASGAVAVQRGSILSCSAYPMQVVDPSGSGDAFTAGVISSVLAGRDLPQTLRYASALGASATRAPGTTDAVFMRDEAEHFVSSNPLTVMEAP
jgi:sugar/nucleoside kinase (ribokinase family)